MEQATTSGAARTGDSTSSHSGNADSPVPKPVSPETNPPAKAPTKTSTSLIPIVL